MRYYESLVDLIGNTPLVKLRSVTAGLEPTVLAKVEYFNPGGSVKDRIAVRMVDAAEESGELKPGGTIIEPTSGNTGIGLAIVAQQRGYKCIFVCPDKVSSDKIDTLRAYGAEVAVCPTAVAPEDPRSYYSVSSGGTGRPYLVEGVGEDFWPDTYDRTVCDKIIPVSDRDSFDMTHRLAREEGLLVGGSCGMAVVAALRAATVLGPDAVMVVLLPDGGRGYLSKIFNDKWMADYGFLQSSGRITIGDVLREKSGETPSLVHAHPNETVREVIDILREYGVSQMPVVKAEPPVTAGEVIGSVSERALLD